MKHGISLDMAQTALSRGSKSGIAPQLPNILNGLAARPAWQVAGVDYGVGIDRSIYPTDAALTDWQTIANGTTILVNTGTGQITLSGTVTLNGVDLSLHGGAFIACTTNNSVITLTNCKFDLIPGGQTYAVHIQTTNCDLTVRHNNWSTSEDWIGFQASGTVTMEYNYIHLGGQHPFEQVSGVCHLISRYNLIHNNVVLAGAHNNWMQWGTIGAGSTAVFEYNTAYHNVIAASVAPGEGPQAYANTSGTLSTCSISFNTFVAVPDGSSNPTMSNIVHGGTVGTGTCQQNYFVTTGCSGGALPLGAFYDNTITAALGWSTISGNINMVNGAVITPSSSSSYSPPLDGVGTLSRAYSTWRLTTAYNGPLIKVSPVAGGAGTDFSATATGEVDWAAISTLTGGSATTYFVEFYDQSGNGANATSGGGTQVLIDPANKRANTNAASTQNWLTFTAAAVAQPFSVVMNYSQKSTVNGGYIWLDSGSNAGFTSGTNLVGAYGGLFPAQVAKTDNAWGVVTNFYNGASSTIDVNGTTSGAQNDGTAGIGAGAAGIGTNPGSANFYRIDMYFDTFVIFSTDPGQTARNTFTTWLRAHAHV